MFKTITLFEFDDTAPTITNEMLAEKELPPLLSQSVESVGFLPVVGREFALTTKGMTFFEVGILTRRITNSMRAPAIEAEIKKRGLTPPLSRDEQNLVDDAVASALTPNTPPSLTKIKCYIDHNRDWLIISTRHKNQITRVTALLRATLGGLSVYLADPPTGATLTRWAANGGSADGHFSVGERVSLIDGRAGAAKIRVAQVPMNSEIVQDRLASGWSVKKIDLSSSAVSLSVSDPFAVSGIKMIDLPEDDQPLDVPLESLILSDLWSNASVLNQELDSLISRLEEEDA